MTDEEKIVEEDKTNSCFIKDGRVVKRTPCSIYLRIMGYLRPISQANIGKKSEIYSRKYFLEGRGEPKIYDLIQTNKEFNNKYAVVG